MKVMISALIGVAAVVVAMVPIFDSKQKEPIVSSIVTGREVHKLTWKCPDCTPEEQYVLKQLQEKTRITDRNALATILGNIKQESKFVANVCEGGARVPYTDCHRGGYGLVQWTTTHRYMGLGDFASKYRCDPSTLECQTRYMINEPIFQRVLPDFEGSGQTVAQYMVPAYYWLGWGIRGPRDAYAYNYTKQMVLSCT